MDSLTTRTYKHSMTGWIINSVWKDKGGLKTENSYDYYEKYEGKTISSVKFKILDAFEPSANSRDSSEVEYTRLNKIGNKLHWKTRTSYIRRNLWFSAGDSLNAQIMTENERFIRSMNNIKDVCFIITQDSIYNDRIHILVLVKDLFSIGVSGAANSIYSASIEVFNRNILGIGNEISLKLIQNTKNESASGFETHYAINNIRDKDIDLRVEYDNTSKRKGYTASLNRDFYSPYVRLAGGFNIDLFDRTYNVSSNEPLINDFPLSFNYFDEWLGYSFRPENKKTVTSCQFTITQSIQEIKFFKHPETDAEYLKYYANSCIYLLGFTWSRQAYRKGYLIYSYGITEDIPTGLKFECNTGYNKNELNNMFYLDLNFSNRVRYPDDSYLYYAAEIGGYLDNKEVDRGAVIFNVDYIAPLYQIVPDFRLRQFISLNYVRGINRLKIENLYLTRSYGIRGFPNQDITGQQRLTLKLETVVFQRQNLLGFNFAYFGFTDFALIGDISKSIFNQNFYSGMGLGIRIRNENLIFNTIEFRLAWYPGNGFGINLDEKDKSEFEGFNPEKPDVLCFE